jgi:hypothetical protein
LLIRMRSQVQVLAGPPPIPAGHSAAGSEPGAAAAGLGRAGAAPYPRRHAHRPFQGPPTRAAGSTTTTHRGHPSSTGRQPRGRRGHLAPPACSRASRRQPPALRTPAWPGRSAGTRRRPRTTGPGPPPISRDQRATRQRRPPPGLLGRRPSRSTARQPTGTSARSCSGGAHCLDLVPAPPPEVGGDRGVRTGGHQRAGHLRAGHQPAGRWTGGRRTPDGWTPDGPTAGSRTMNPDGWTPHAGHRPATGATGGVLAVSTTATTPDRWVPAGGSAGQTPVGRATTQDARQHGLRGAPRCYGRAWPPPRPSAAGATPPSSWRLGALLSSDDFGLRVERDGSRHPLWRVLGSVAWSVLGGGRLEQRPSGGLGLVGCSGWGVGCWGADGRGSAGARPGRLPGWGVRVAGKVTGEQGTGVAPRGSHLPP